MSVLKAGSICPTCLKPVQEKDNAVLIAAVNVLSKPRVDHGLTQSSFALRSLICFDVRRMADVPRYLMHVDCLRGIRRILEPTAENLYALERVSRGSPDEGDLNE